MDEQKVGATLEPGATDAAAAPGETVQPASTGSQTLSETQAAEAANATPQKSTTRFVVIIILIVACAGLAYYFLLDGGVQRNNDSAESTTSTDVDSEAVVARVNGEELFGEDLNYQKLQIAQLMGIADLDSTDETTKKQIQNQALDAIVNTEILIQSAENAGLSVTEDEVDGEYASIIESIGGDEVANERLAFLGITEDYFKKNLRSDILIQKYVSMRDDIADVTVTDEEIQAFYDEVTDGATENVPPLEEVRFQIEEQLQFQKEQQVLSELLESLRQGSNVELLLK